MTSASTGLQKLDDSSSITKKRPFAEFNSAELDVNCQNQKDQQQLSARKQRKPIAPKKHESSKIASAVVGLGTGTGASASAPGTLKQNSKMTFAQLKKRKTVA